MQIPLMSPATPASVARPSSSAAGEHPSQGVTYQRGMPLEDVAVMNHPLMQHMFKMYLSASGGGLNPTVDPAAWCNMRKGAALPSRPAQPMFTSTQAPVSDAGDTGPFWFTAGVSRGNIVAVGGGDRRDSRTGSGYAGMTTHGMSRGLGSILRAGIPPSPLSGSVDGNDTPLGMGLPNHGPGMEADGSPNHRRNYLRRQRNKYHKNQRSLGGPNSRTHIPTDENGEVTALRTVLNRSIRNIAGRVLDVTAKEFSSHPEVAFELIQRDIDSEFSFDPPLRPNYIKSYMKDALSWTRYQWRSHWRTYKKRHPQCSQKLYPTFVAQWDTEEGDMETERMSNACRHRGRRSRTQTGRAEVSDYRQTMLESGSSLFARSMIVHNVSKWKLKCNGVVSRETEVFRSSSIDTICLYIG